MKILFLVILIVVKIPCDECSFTKYLKGIPIVGSVVEKTSQATSYIIEKGIKLKNQITGYFDTEHTTQGFSTAELAAAHGYAAETHSVVTDDGYILALHRIPYSKHSISKKSPRKTVLLHHGVLGSSADWIMSGPGKGLAYILSDSGYDVWMANARGNTYSRAHISRSIDDYEFWNFTFHEVGRYDLPAVIDHITDVKGCDTKIKYVGYSMGTTVLFVLLTTRPRYNAVLGAGVALAPVAFMRAARSPLRRLARYSGNVAYWMRTFGANEFLPQNEIITRLSKSAYKLETKKHKGVVMKNLLFVLCGYDEEQFNKSLVPIILEHVPAGTSTKTLIHYAQEIHNEGEFQQYDYGMTGNMKQYGTPKPPVYPVEEITLPIALISANNDWLSSAKDVAKLYGLLQNPIEHYVVPYRDFNHIDYLWGIDAPSLVYDKLLQLLEASNDGVSGT